MPEQWSIAGAALKCVACEKEFKPGDEVASGLYQEGAEFVRRDFCPSCWETRSVGDEFSFWRHVVPEPEDEEAKKKRRLDASLNANALLDVFTEMADHPDPRRRRFRFVLALMLMRRKKLKFMSITKRKMDDGEQDVLVLKQAGRGAKRSFDVVDVKMSEEEMVSAQDQVGGLLVMGGVEVALPASGEVSEGAPGTSEDAVAVKVEGGAKDVAESQQAEEDPPEGASDGGDAAGDGPSEDEKEPGQASC